MQQGLEQLMFNVYGVTADVLQFSEDENSFIVDPERNELFLTDLEDDDLDSLDKALLGGPFEHWCEAQNHIEQWFGWDIIKYDMTPNDSDGFSLFHAVQKRWYLRNMDPDDGTAQFIGIIEA